MTDRGVTMNIDDMRVGDFLHLIDCMQEECYEHKRCDKCRYHDICGSDIGSIETISLRETVESYAEMNGLLEHMHYVTSENEMKWIQCSDRLPDKDGSYLIQHDFGGIGCLDYADGWNCRRDYLSGEIYRDYESHSVVAWMPLPEPYKGKINER